MGIAERGRDPHAQGKLKPGSKRALSVAVFGATIGILISCLAPPPVPSTSLPIALSAAPSSGPAPIAIAEEPPYAWKNVTIGGGGFVTGIIFNPTRRGLLYARTDVGGAYRKDPDSDTWVPLLDGLGQADWNLQGVESLATDPGEPKRVVIAAGTYTNPDVSNAEVLRSTDYGKTWQRTPLPFKTGGNEAGRGNGERLAIDPRSNNILYLGTRRDGLWRSEDYGVAWRKVETFPDVPDDSVKHQPPPSEPWRFNYLAQAVGIVFVLFDSSAAVTPTSRIYAAISTSAQSLFCSDDTGKTWKPVSGQPLGLRPNHAALSSEGVLYITYGDEPGPNGMRDGAVWKYEIKKKKWTNITPEKPRAPDHTLGYAAVSVDAAHPKTLVVSTWNRRNPHDEIFRSTDAGLTWKPLLGNPEWEHSVAPYTKTMHHHWISDIEIDPFDSNHILFTTGYGIWASRNLTDADGGKATRWSFDDGGLEETVPLALISPPRGPHLLSGLGDIDGFCHDDLNLSPAARFDAPGFKNTEWLDFAEKMPTVIVRTGTTYGRDRILGAWSEDSGAHWQGFAAEPPLPAEGLPYGAVHGTGPIAISADGSAIVWTTHGNPPYLTNDRGQTWRAVEGAPKGLRLVADRVESKQLYGYDTVDGVVYVSRNGGANVAAEFRGLPVVPKRRWPVYADVHAVPERPSEFWLVVNGKALHFTLANHAVRELEGVEDVTALGFGKSSPHGNYPALYVAAKIRGAHGIYRSDNAGESFKRINDDNHQFGSITHIAGDPRLFGRVYLATGGRGIIYGEPKSR